MNPREIVLMWIAGVLTLFVITFVSLKSQSEAWSLRALAITRLDSDIADARRWEAETPALEGQLASLKSKVPPLPEGQVPDTYLPRKISELVQQNKVTLSERKTGKFQKQAGLHIMPVECRWDTANTKGIKDLLIAFAESDVMMDVTELIIISKGNDQLTGSFAVNCIFSR